jgi:hypothetical protein
MEPLHKRMRSPGQNKTESGIFLFGHNDLTK